MLSHLGHPGALVCLNILKKSKKPEWLEQREGQRSSIWYQRGVYWEAGPLEAPTEETLFFNPIALAAVWRASYGGGSGVVTGRPTRELLQHPRWLRWQWGRNEPMGFANGLDVE